MADTDAPLLRFQSVTKRFGGTLAIDAISLDVKAGEVLALLGENGAGKSTLIKVLAGIHTADSGAVLYRGAPHNAAQKTGRIAFIHQDLGLIEWMTVAENVALALGYPRRSGRIDWRAADSGSIGASSVTLYAGGAIGASAPVRLAATSGDIQSGGTGDVAVAFVNPSTAPVTLTGLAATGGAVRISSTSAINVGGLTARDLISLTTSNGDIGANNIESATGAIRFDSAGAFTANTLTAAGAITGNAAHSR